MSFVMVKNTRKMIDIVVLVHKFYIHTTGVNNNNSNNNNYNNNKSTACGTNTRLPRAIILHEILVKMRHNSRNIAFRVMSLVLSLHLVMMS